MNDSIVMVAAGMKKKKKDFINNSIKSIYLNYGLLGLATILYEKGYLGTRMFQGDDKDIDIIIDEIICSGIQIETLNYPVFVSVPSFFSVSWALEFIHEIKIINPRIKIILGGRWVIDNNLNWVKDQFSEVDFFSQGCGDSIIDKILYEENWNSLKDYVGKAEKHFSKFNYTLLNNFKEYQPCIEICRGCGRKCEFCLEKNYPVSEIKSPLDTILEIKEVCNTYDNNNLNFYFEASIFNPSIEWAKSFYKYYKEYEMNFKWRFETRVDTINLESISILSKAGLKVIDLGLESASPTQLMRMGKTKNPQIYLNKAENLIKEMHNMGIWAKLNILLYIGETNESINETTNWLDRNSNYFKGVSVNPLILYLNGEHTEPFIKTIIDTTTIEPNIDELYRNGFTFIDLSKEILLEETKKISKFISDKYMSNEDYLDFKKVCYTKINL